MNYYEGKMGCPTPVGVYARGATPDGILDMAGNVWEWCSDWFGRDYYAESPGKNPKGPASGSVRVLRGGAWNSSPRSCRSTYRIRDEPDARIDCFGFRLASVSFGLGLSE